jgi:hypothetical protein
MSIFWRTFYSYFILIGGGFGIVFGLKGLAGGLPHRSGDDWTMTIIEAVAFLAFGCLLAAWITVKCGAKGKGAPNA